MTGAVVSAGTLRSVLPLVALVGVASVTVRVRSVIGCVGEVDCGATVVPAGAGRLGGGVHLLFVFRRGVGPRVPYGVMGLPGCQLG